MDLQPDPTGCFYVLTYELDITLEFITSSHPLPYTFAKYRPPSQDWLKSGGGTVG